MQTTYSADLLEIADGHGFSSFRTGGFDPPYNFTVAPGFGEAHQASVIVNGADDFDRRRYLAKRGPAAATVDFDANELLPLLSDLDLDTDEPARPVISWAGNTAQTDGGLARLHFFGPDREHFWTFVVKPGATTVKAPALPAEAASFVPDATADFAFPDVVYMESDLVADYAAFRGIQGALVGTFEVEGYNFAIPPLPANGKIRATLHTSTPR